MRILHVLGGLGCGGAETMVVNLYRAINKNDVQFDYVVHSLKDNHYINEVKKMGARIYYFPAFNGINIINYCILWCKLLRNHQDYKIIHSHLRSYAIIYLLIAKMFGVKTIVHSHSTSNGKGIKSFIKWLLQLPLRCVADYLFACSEEAGKWLFGQNCTNKDNYMMIPNGIDIKKFNFNECVRKDIRRSLNINNDDFVIGHVGRFHEAKNHEFIIDIFNDIVENKKNSKLLLVGDGPLKNKIQEKVKEYNLMDKVIFVGTVSDVEKYYQAMDIFLFPSKWEGLPVSVVEAQAAGLPCIVSNTVTHDVEVTNLLTYKSINDEISSWSDTCLKSQIFSRDLLDNDENRGLELFNIENVALKLCNFYKKISM